MPDAEVNHIYDYDPKYLADILSSVKTIALVGASADKTKLAMVFYAYSMKLDIQCFQ